MTTPLYVRSTDGDNADNGSTWALAKLNLHTATTGALAVSGSGGGIIYLSQAHAGSYAVSGLAYNILGTLAAPTKIIAGDDGAAPPTTVATATETNSGGADWSFIGGCCYWYGITFTSSYASTNNFYFDAYATTVCMEFENCTFDNGAGSAGGVKLGHTTQSTNDKGLRLFWKNCNLKLVNATSATITCYNPTFEWVGGSLITNTNLPTYLFTLSSAYYQKITVTGVDLSVLGSGKTLVNAATTVGGADIKFINCKLGSSVALASRPTSFTQRIAMYGCDVDNGKNPYRFQIVTYAGDITSETGIYLTAGASDGTTVISWKMVSTANTTFPNTCLESDEIAIWNETTGSAITVTVEFLIDSATTLNNNDVWMEVIHLGTSGQETAVLDRDSMVADILTTAAECSAGAGVGSWTGDGAGAKSYKLVSTITPQNKGFIRAKIMLAKASTTIYVNPKLTVA